MTGPVGGATQYIKMKTELINDIKILYCKKFLLLLPGIYSELHTKVILILGPPTPLSKGSSL